MTIRNPSLVLLQILLLPLLTAHVSTCNRSCGSNTLQYHFGFSSGCNISLSCNNSNIFISEFPVLFIVTENIMITVEATCNHPFQNLHQLYNPNYAPTFRNTILLESCSTPISPCILPPRSSRPNAFPISAPIPPVIRILLNGMNIVFMIVNTMAKKQIQKAQEQKLIDCKKS